MQNQLVKAYRDIYTENLIWQLTLPSTSNRLDVIQQIVQVLLQPRDSLRLISDHFIKSFIYQIVAPGIINSEIELSTAVRIYQIYHDIYEAQYGFQVIIPCMQQEKHHCSQLFLLAYCPNYLAEVKTSTSKIKTPHNMEWPLDFLKSSVLMVFKHLLDSSSVQKDFKGVQIDPEQLTECIQLAHHLGVTNLVKAYELEETAYKDRLSQRIQFVQTASGLPRNPEIDQAMAIYGLEFYQDGTVPVRAITGENILLFSRVKKFYVMDVEGLVNGIVFTKDNLLLVQLHYTLLSRDTKCMFKYGVIPAELWNEELSKLLPHWILTLSGDTLDFDTLKKFQERGCRIQFDSFTVSGFSGDQNMLESLIIQMATPPVGKKMQVSRTTPSEFFTVELVDG